VINWITAAALSLPEQPDYQEIPEVTQIDKLQTYIGKKNLAGDCRQQRVGRNFSLCNRRSFGGNI
jgi:hypothetical protein